MIYFFSLFFTAATFMLSGTMHSEKAQAQDDLSPAPVPGLEGEFSILPGQGDRVSQSSYASFKLHLEFKVPLESEKTGQDRGNSGVYLHGLYEIQILDSWNNETYLDGSCGALYKQAAPLQNASRPPEEWQEYDVEFTAPVIGVDGAVITAGVLSLWHNGTMILDHVAVSRPTGSAGNLPQHGYGPLRLQDHGSAVRFRNILIWPHSS